MSKLLNLGMPLIDVIAAVTSRAAQAIHRPELVGSLELDRWPTSLFWISSKSRWSWRTAEVRFAPWNITSWLGTPYALVPWWGAPAHPGVGTSLLFP